ncbi:MAG: hypothetical protein JNL39_11100 [Opitutaceae bacterium]|nr:hypothetical protein [Opitutaceae bacterium]
MKSFRVYVGPGRILSAAGWCATLAAIAAMIVALAFPDLWEPLFFSIKSASAKGLIVAVGLVTFGIVGGILKLAGFALSKDEKRS